MISTENIAEAYVRLALAIDQHRPGYIDSYCGPAEWREEATREGSRPLDDLSRQAAELAEAVAAGDSLDAQRKDFLSRHVRAMQTSLHLLGGVKMPLADEADSIYDCHPSWTDESAFEHAHSRLNELLPPGGSLPDRLTVRKRMLQISIEKASELLPFIRARLRQAARERFPLPEQETLDFQFVSGHPWTAYNWYLGAGRSRIDINTDLPLRADRLVELVAHEAYPGHHTELSIKDTRLHEREGHLEHSLTLLNAPSSVVSEGIATSALAVIMPGEALDAWYADEIFPRAGLDPTLSRGAAAISEMQDDLDGAGDNAALMLHERGASTDEVIAYLLRFKLLTEQEALKRIDFMSDPLDRAYIFTYGAGRQLLRLLFVRKQDVTHWFTRLLTEPVTPSQIRAWIEAKNNNPAPFRPRRLQQDVLRKQEGGRSSQGGVE